MKLEKYGPKGNLSPTLGDPCAICRRTFVAGDFTTLMRRSASGRYANDGTEVHWDCAVQLHEQVASTRNA